MIEMFLVDLCARERFQKIRELNGVVTMILNAYTLGRGEYRSTTIELCGVKSHAHIGDEGAQHQHKIRRLDVLADMLVAAHRSAIHADVEPMVLTNRAFAQ